MDTLEEKIQMLKTIRKYRKSLIGVLAIAAIVLVMTGFGVNFVSFREEPHAIQIDDVKITYSDFQRERRNVEDRYRVMLGENYSKLAPTLLANLNDRLVDQLIENVLLKREATRLGLYVGKRQLREILFNQVFSHGFDAAQYQGFLNQIGMTAKEFEDRLAEDALRSMLRGFIRDISFVPQRELRTLIERNETSYDVSYIELSPAAFEEKVKSPSEDQILAYYENHAVEYETKPAVSYDYVVFDPKDYKNLVEIQPEDIEFYYLDHKNEFKTVDKVKARHIQLNYPAKADPEAMLKVKKKAEDVHARAASGEDFASLALQFSDDITTKTLGGDLGWIKRGERDQAFEKAVFDMKSPGLAPLIETDYGYEIVMVDEYVPPGVKKLEDVRQEIEEKIRTREAPAFTAAYAEGVFDEFKKSGKSLKEFAVEKGLKVASTPGLLEAVRDPEPRLKGVTRKILDFPEEKKQLVDSGALTVMAEIKEFRDSEIPALEKVKDKVVAAVKHEKAKELVKDEAEKIVKELKAMKRRDLRALAKARNLTVRERKALRSALAVGPVFGNSKIKDWLFNVAKAGDVSEEAYQINDNYYIFAVENIKRPAEKLLREKMRSAEATQKTQMAELMLKAIVNRLKVRSKIDIDPNLLAES
ncbi:MAG: hypothetical protein D6719_06305 [Candidatus Dadabacteria bacterium]|nr:MAG: hypothetical protein D6719_06305 [Candidatus Dadabacteria bacterium]